MMPLFQTSARTIYHRRIVTRRNRIRGMLSVGAVLMAGVLTAPCALAQGGDRAAAEALFEKGRTAMDKGDYATACAAFEESNRLDPAPGTLFNQADCEEKRGHLATAWQLFDLAISKIPETDERRESVQDRADSLKARLPHLTITLGPGAPPDSKVMRDQFEVRPVTFGVSIPVDPGAHTIIVTAPGRAESRVAVQLAEGESKEIAVEPGPAAGATVASTGPAQADTSPKGHFNKRTAGYVIGGIGVAGIGTALVLGAVALGKKSTVNQHCDATTRVCDSPEGLDAASSGSTIATVSTVSFIVGAAATGLGVYFVLTSNDGDKTSVGAIPRRGGGMLGITREF